MLRYHATFFHTTDKPTFELSETVHGIKVFPNFQPPSPYTSELYGMEYLLQQSGQTMPLSDLDSEIDEGFEEEMADEVDTIDDQDPQFHQPWLMSH